mgnify:CR=1 FL=1
MKIVILGSEGFIATNLCFLLREKYEAELELIGIDSGTNGSNNKQFTSSFCKHFAIDLNDSDALSDVIKDSDLIIHLAAKGNVIESIENPLINFESNVKATISLLEAMRKSNCSKIIFSSTCGALMGNTPPPVSEESIPRPISPYGSSKLACEGYLSSYAETFDIKSIILRFGNVYGPYSLHKKGVINKWIKQLINSEDIIIFGKGTSSRDFINVGDICSGIDKSIKRIFSKGDIDKFEIFHLANNEEINLKNLYEILSSIIPSNSKLIFKPERKGEVIQNFSKYNKAMRILDFSPKIGLEKGLKDLYKWIDKYDTN